MKPRTVLIASFAAMLAQGAFAQDIQKQSVNDELRADFDLRPVRKIVTEVIDSLR